MRAALVLAALAAAAADKAEISEDIVVRSRAAGPGVQAAPPAASKPVVDEVLRSLSLGRGRTAPAAERVRVSADAARFARPYPEPPFLALSPANIEALYDDWTFQVLDGEGEIAWRSEGVGLLRETVDWDGGGPNGRLAVTAGKSYRYRFTGRRGGRAFVIESDPLPLASFTHREYAGETRLEAATSALFVEEKASWRPDAARLLESLAARLRAADQRPDGSFKLELYARDLRSKLTADRAKALRRRLAELLVVAPERIAVSLMPVSRGEAVAAFLPPARGGSLRIE